jgi:predicted esterase
MKSRPVVIIAHENERVIPASKRKKVERLMHKAGMKLTNRKRKSGR